MKSLPSEVGNVMAFLRPLLRVEVFVRCCSLMAGILIGEAKAGTVRVSVFAGPDDGPQRLSDLLCRHKLSPQACMAKLVASAWAVPYPAGLPARRCWIADSPYPAKPYAKRIASVGLLHRPKRVAGQAKHRQGHCDVFAAPLSQPSLAKAAKGARVLVGAVLGGHRALDPCPGGRAGAPTASACGGPSRVAGRPWPPESPAPARLASPGP